MATTTIGIKVDDALRERIRQAAHQLGRTPHWVLKQAITQYVDALERGTTVTAIASLNTKVEDESAFDVVQPLPAQEPAQEVQPFLVFAQSVLPQTPLRAAITAAWYRPEAECLATLLPLAQSDDAAQARQVHDVATHLVQGLRDAPVASGVAALVQEFSLSSHEGVALMCLAEALLRIPDKATRDALIRDKISKGDWLAHVGHSPSLFVNAATWGLVLTGKLTATSSEKNLSSALTRVIGKGGEPLIRQGVYRAMKLMGEQFVTGQHIAEALANSRHYEKQGFRYSYDMLGEAAATQTDAQRYMRAYEQAIHAIGAASQGRGIFEGPGISIKLSALHPRYVRAQYERVMQELLPKLLALAELAKKYDIGMNIDAEEADRLELSLDLLESLCAAPSLKGWNGIGFVVQAYQKRCPYVIDYLIDLARRNRRRLMVRLVKGAYWDSEIKRAQIDGLPDYPVYTRKVYTDMSYLACARKLLQASDALYPQFATHNAQTLASVYHLAHRVGGSYYSGQYEFQCLHGMGEALYTQVTGHAAQGKLARPCRIYAPVGSHETLLAYLVRRLLENGANTSFVNRIGDSAVPIADLVVDPVDEVLRIAHEEGTFGAAHPRIPLPGALWTSQGALARANSVGLNLAHEQQLASLAVALLSSTRHVYTAAAPDVSVPQHPQHPQQLAHWQPLLNPAQLGDVVGWVYETSPAGAHVAAQRAAQAAPIWAGTPPVVRADVLARAADMLEQRSQLLMGLIVREAGKTLASAVAEIREAVDFLRYYGAQVATQFDNAQERPLGVVLAISPWNFPLAIFCGQVAAALAAGNAVLAKPAEQTPLSAAAMVNILHEAGVPRDVVQLIPGAGETVGAALVAHPVVAGVLFTGSTQVAHAIARQLAQRLSPQGRCIAFIAETGGQNAMMVDSSALAEQVVADVLTSAFDSAGQRCSALRLLCVQEDVADRLVSMLCEALQEWTIGNPDRLATDIGPVIDAQARQQIEAHIQRMAAASQKVTRVHVDGLASASPALSGYFVAPAIIEIDSMSRLTHEVFGPVLHVMRFARAQRDDVVDQINAMGYGLTFGIHSRIDETIDAVCQRIHAGNIYVNRNMIGAVVGVQPFGGMGLSGTGPKAGGPLYLRRLVQESDGQEGVQARLCLPISDAACVTEQAASHAPLSLLMPLHDSMGERPTQWAVDGLLAQAQAMCTQALAQAQGGTSWLLPSPTGESNRYRMLARGPVWALPRTPLGLLAQVVVSWACGNVCHVVLPQEQAHGDVRGCALLWQALCTFAQGAAVPWLERMPCADSAQFASASGIGVTLAPSAAVAVVLFEGDGDALLQLNQDMAARDGALVRVQSRSSEELHAGHGYCVSALWHEQCISTNTAAAGGNAQLMTMA